MLLKRLWVYTRVTARWAQQGPSPDAGIDHYRDRDMYHRPRVQNLKYSPRRLPPCQNRASVDTK